MYFGEERREIERKDTTVGINSRVGGLEEKINK